MAVGRILPPSLVSVNDLVGTCPHPFMFTLNGWLCSVASELSRFERDPSASEAENTHHYKKGLPASVLYH